MESGPPEPRAPAERQRREEMWRGLLRARGPLGVAPDVLPRLDIYDGAQGVWVDKVRTASLTEGGSGIAVGLLHTRPPRPAA